MHVPVLNSEFSLLDSLWYDIYELRSKLWSSTFRRGISWQSGFLDIPWITIGDCQKTIPRKQVYDRLWHRMLANCMLHDRVSIGKACILKFYACKCTQQASRLRAAARPAASSTSTSTRTNQQTSTSQQHQHGGKVETLQFGDLTACLCLCAPCSKLRTWELFWNF